jgi:hypothetical protein
MAGLRKIGWILTCALLIGCKAAGSGSNAGGAAGAAGAGASSGLDGGAGTGGSGATGSGGTSGSTGDAGVPGPICFLTNCSSNAECHDCSFGRTHCDVAAQRCVTCDPSSGAGCASGLTCTKYGTCAPQGQTCPTDAQGNPTVTCSTDQDCASCNPMHQICNATTHKCVNCSSSDVSACQGNEYCSASGSCTLKCPTTCSADSDCAQCGSASAPAHACDLAIHKCAQCSATSPCAGGAICTPQGECMKSCGVSGQPKGTCTADSDCTGCGADLYACETPINGGNGKCGVPASGCSDLGAGTLALPPPWNSVTNTCSSDADCSNVGLNLNVGKILRDISGISAIKDATFQYEMNSCASVTVGLPNSAPVSCGICVPCTTDADCSPIQVDPIIDQMFGGLGGVLAKWVLNQLYGDKPHVLNMYCQNVAGDYGVCAPCADPSSACGVASTTGQGCTDDWQCAAGEYCDNGQCADVGSSCFGGGSTCPSGKVCAWNGDQYCCRSSGGGTQVCATDAECTAPDVCAYNGQGYYCQPKVACN